MNRIEIIFQSLRSADGTAIMPYVTAGYPSLTDTARAITAMENAGASVIEIGIPFSDPIADGPLIAAAMHEALEQGVTPRSVLQTIASVRERTRLGLVVMVSESIVLRMGTEAFIEEAAAAGVDGLIVPDLDLEAAEPIAAAARNRGMSLSLLIAPTTTPHRAKEIVALCSGFVYLLARGGVTGERDAAPDVAERIAMIREMTDLPIAVGFGISRPEHVAAASERADAVIVGSAVVRAMGEAARAGGDAAEAAAGVVRTLASGLRKGASAAPRPQAM